MAYPIKRNKQILHDDDLKITSKPVGSGKCNDEDHMLQTGNLLKILEMKLPIKFKEKEEKI